MKSICILVLACGLPLAAIGSPMDPPGRTEVKPTISPKNLQAIFGEAETYMAIIDDRTVKQGDTHRGFFISRISKHQVELVKGSKKMKLMLFETPVKKSAN